MSKGGGAQETPQQRLMTEHAVNLMNDYRQRWLPVQKKLIAQVQAEGAPNSEARREAAGKAATDTQMGFSAAQGEVEKQLTNSGAAIGSSKSNLAETGLGAELGKAKGFGTTISDQQIDEAYTQGLSALMSIGQGKGATVSNARANQAQLSGASAAAAAGAQAASQQGTGQLLGTAAGFGLQSAIGGFGTQAPPAVQPWTANVPNNLSGYVGGP